MLEIFPASAEDIRRANSVTNVAHKARFFMLDDIPVDTTKRRLVLTAKLEQWMNEKESVTDNSGKGMDNGFIVTYPATFVTIYDAPPKLYRDDGALYQSICNVLGVKPVRSRKGLVVNTDTVSVWWNRNIHGVFMWKRGVNQRLAATHTRYSNRYRYEFTED